MSAVFFAADGTQQRAIHAEEPAMMPKLPSLQFSVMCLNLIEESGKPPTLQHVLYDLPFRHLPFRMDRFYIINCWTNGEGQFQQSVKIMNPARTQTFIETGEQAFTLEGSYTPQWMINAFANLEFSERGCYWVEVCLNGKLILDYPLPVRPAVGAAASSTAPGPS